MGINNVVLMGRLTFEPELKATPSGVSVLRFTVAIDRNVKDKHTDFIECVAWKQTAEFISKYFHKGDMISLTGAIQTNNFTDKNGNKRKSVDVVVYQTSFCGSKTESKPNLNVAEVDNSDFEEIIDDDDDLPF